jgi:hypothetical protein
MIVLIPYLYLLAVSVLIACIISRVILHKNIFNLIFSLINTPILISLSYYAQFYFFPNKPPFFYVLISIFLLILLFLINGKTNLTIYFSHIWRSFKELFSLHLSFFSKILLILIASIIVLSSLRIWCWPINWDDQIYYIEQGYSIGQDRGIGRYTEGDYFKNDQLQYQINSAIRPGLPLLYSLSSLFSFKLQDTVLFSQIITFHYFILLLLALIYLGRKYSIIAIFLTLTCYLFINLSVFGFKEQIIVSQILLIIYLISRKSVLQWSNLILIGIVFGLMSYINYSGTLISGIFILITLLCFKDMLSIKLLKTGALFFLLTIFSGLESLNFIGISYDASFKNININKIYLSAITHFQSRDKDGNTRQYNLAEKNKLQPTNKKSLTASDKELLSYDIHNKIELYTKGKLQGFFQFQYFGIIFNLFALTVLFRFKNIINDKISKYLLLFVGFFYLFFIDIFHINGNQYSTVLSISHKYSAMIVPFLSIIIAKNIDWWKNLLNKLTPFHFTIGITIFTFIRVLLPEELTKFLLNFVRLIVPLHNSLSYYENVIRLIVNVVFMFSVLFVLVVTIMRYLYGHRFLRFWLNNNISFIVVIFITLYIPFLLFFHTNFGLDNTFFYSFSPRSVQLAYIKGWGSLYSTVIFLNKLPKGSHFMFINRNISQLAIHFTFSASNIFTYRDMQKYNDPYEMITKSITKLGINYLLVDPNEYNFNQYRLVHLTPDFAVYQTYPTQ